MRNLVDVHILRLHDERNDWFDYCIESLEKEPVNIHVIDGVYGHIGLGRQKGLMLGAAPYVAYVDPDDMVCRGAFSRCVEGLEADNSKVMAYTREARISEGGVLISEWDKKLYEPFFGQPEEALRAHHLSVYRRSALPDLTFLADYPTVPEQALKQKMWNNNFLFIDHVGYQWRMHNNNSTTKVKDHPEHVKKILRQQTGLWRFIV